MGNTIKERVASINKKIKRDKSELDEMIKDVNNIKTWMKKHPKQKELWAPYMGYVDVKKQLQFGNRKIAAQKKEIAKRKKRLAELKRLL